MTGSVISLVRRRCSATFGVVLVVLLALSLSCEDLHPVNPAVRVREGNTHVAASTSIPTVVATTSILADVVSNIACDGQAHVESLVPVNADPHAYQASLADRAVMESAVLVVANGLLESGLDKTIRSVEETGIEVFRVLDHVDTLPVTGNDGHIGEPSHSQEGDYEDGIADPHVWLDPVRVSAMLPKLMQRLVDTARLDSRILRECLYRTQGVLDRVDAEIMAMVAEVPQTRRVLVANHDSLDYFADRYGFEVIGSVIPGISTLAAPSPAHLEELGARMKAIGSSVIFVQAGHYSGDAEALAKHLGDVRVVELLPEGFLNVDQRFASYVELLRSNARLITDALIGGQHPSQHAGHGLR